MKRLTARRLNRPFYVLVLIILCYIFHVNFEPGFNIITKFFSVLSLERWAVSWELTPDEPASTLKLSPQEQKADDNKATPLLLNIRRRKEAGKGSQ